MCLGWSDANGFEKWVTGMSDVFLDDDPWIFLLLFEGTTIESYKDVLLGNDSETGSNVQYDVCLSKSAM